MDVTWLGGSCFRLQSGVVSVLTDPFDLPSPTGPLAADIVTLSTRDARDRVAVTGAFRLVDGPGEYEIKGVPVTGVATRRQPTEGQEQAPPNFVYTIQMDGVIACHLGRMNRPPTSQEVQEIGAPDMLFVPLGEPQGLTVQQAIALASQLESKVLVPIFSAVDGQTALERFCRELGSDPNVRETKLSVSSSGLPATARAAVLSRQEPVGSGG